MGQATAFRLDRVNQCFWANEESVSLSPKAFAVLSYLVERPGVLVTKQELLDAVWPDVNVTEGVLKRAVLEIRKALADPAEEPRFIQTLHRRGYRFIGPRAGAKPSQARRGIVVREAELGQLDGWFEEARQGSRRVVFLTGEAGIGKTTVVDEWAGRVTGTGT